MFEAESLQGNGLKRKSQKPRLQRHSGIRHAGVGKAPTGGVDPQGGWLGKKYLQQHLGLCNQVPAKELVCS